jgi:hypothetical protein
MCAFCFYAHARHLSMVKKGGWSHCTDTSEPVVGWLWNQGLSDLVLHLINRSLQQIWETCFMFRNSIGHCTLCLWSPSNNCHASAVDEFVLVAAACVFSQSQWQLPRAVFVDRRHFLNAKVKLCTCCHGNQACGNFGSCPDIVSPLTAVQHHHLYPL